MKIQKKPPIISDQIINAAIPDNIEKFVTWLTVERQIKYNDFLNASAKFQNTRIKEFIKKHPEVLQLKLF